jgi:hypothetical protein
MPTEKLSMRKIKQILQLHYESGLLPLPQELVTVLSPIILTEPKRLVSAGHCPITKMNVTWNGYYFLVRRPKVNGDLPILISLRYRKTSS